MMAEQDVSADAVGAGSGKDGRITKGDVLAFLDRPAPRRRRPRRSRRASAEAGEERVRMTRLRRTIAARLKEAQNTAAMLTTFNEVDMTAVDARCGANIATRSRRSTACGSASCASSCAPASPP